MLTPLLFMLMAASSSSAGAMEGFSLKARQAPRCAGKCADRYRLQLTDDEGGDAKARALRENAAKCNVVGAQRCLSRRRLMWSSDDRGPLAALAGTLGLH